MARTNSFAQNKIDPTRPFFAAVGSVDAAVAFARDPKAIPTKTVARVKESVNELTETVDEWNQQYVDLAARGRTLVGRIRRQQATQDLKAETKKTTSRAKTTRTRAAKTADQATDSAKKATDSAKKSARATGAQAKSTRSSAKATGTSAKKTASAAKKATQDAAAKTGN